MNQYICSRCGKDCEGEHWKRNIMCSNIQLSATDAYTSNDLYPRAPKSGRSMQEKVS